MASHNISHETPTLYPRVGFVHLDYPHNHHTHIGVAELKYEYLWQILWVTVYKLTHSLRPPPYTKLWLSFVFEKQKQISFQSQHSK
jgi:hypothetical protein